MDDVRQNTETVTVHLRGLAGAPKMRSAKFEFANQTTVADVKEYLTSVLGSEQPVHLFVASSFAPTPDQTLAFLREHFAKGGAPLEICYSFDEVWG